MVHPICKRAGVKNVHKYLSGEPYHHPYDNMEKGTIRWTLIKGVPSILNPPGPNLGNTCSMHTVGNTQSYGDICGTYHYLLLRKMNECLFVCFDSVNSQAHLCNYG